MSSKFRCQSGPANPVIQGNSPQELEDVDTIQTAVEQEVVDPLNLLLTRHMLLNNAAQGTGQPDQSLNVPTVACTFASLLKHVEGLKE